MIKKNILYLFFGIVFTQTLFAQQKNDSLVVQMDIKFDKLPLILNKTYVSNKDTLQIDLLRFYISAIQVDYSDKSVFRQANSFHLINIENPNTFRIPICDNSKKEVSKISFNVGIDSLTNVSGALGGDLDPANGMYWAWQSGYINMKIEGTSTSCKTRKNAFQFHIGGYLKPYFAMRTVTLETKKTNSIIPITIDLAEFFSKIKLSETNSVMIPGKQAMQLADYSQKLFKTE